MPEANEAAAQHVAAADEKMVLGDHNMVCLDPLRIKQIFFRPSVIGVKKLVNLLAKNCFFDDNENAITELSKDDIIKKIEALVTPATHIKMPS